MARPIAIDLFAGVGGLSLGFEQAGFDVVAAADIDPVHCAAHKFNFPYGTTLCASVIDLTGKKIRKSAGIGAVDVDVVVGGAPCQGFSMIGKRALDDPRNQLVHHFVRIVTEIRPKYFVFENVKGLTVGKHKRFLQEIIEEFTSAGYDVVRDYKVLNAEEYGVPQSRHRLFLMGARKGLKLPAYPQPTDEVTVRDALADLPDAERYSELWERDFVEAKFGKPSQYAAKLRGIVEDETDFGYSRKWNSKLLTSSRLTEHNDTSRRRFSETAPDSVEPTSRFKKLALDGVCNTLRAGTASDRGAFTSPRPIHPIYPRVITVREAARLHSYPDWFRFHSTKWHGFRQIGNSVPPLLGRAVGSSIIRALQKKPVRPSRAISLGDESLLAVSMTEAAAYFGVSKNVIGGRTRTARSQLELGV